MPGRPPTMYRIAARINESTQRAYYAGSRFGFPSYIPQAPRAAPAWELSEAEKLVEELNNARNLAGANPKLGPWELVEVK